MIRNHCTYEGCDAYFVASSVRAPGPHNDPPGTTGWRFEGWADDDLPAHDHTLETRPCYLCDSDHPPQVQVLSEFTTDAHRDPTAAYRLACGHTVIDL